MVNKASYIFTGIKAVFVMATFLFLLSGCGQGTSSGQGSERNWEPGMGTLPDQIGEKLSPEMLFRDDLYQMVYNTGDSWETTDYPPPTGKWFFLEGEGKLGYGLTSGTQKKGSKVAVQLFAPGEKGVQVNRDVRVRLTILYPSIDKKEILLEEKVHVETVEGTETIFTTALPDTDNVLYFLSAEILNEKKMVEDTRVSAIYVPKEDMNVLLRMERENYQSSDRDATLIVENIGPTFLTFGMHYSVEKKVGDTWRKVPEDMVDTVFPEVALYLEPNKNYEQPVNISGLNNGTYRVIKKFRAEGVDLTATLATIFTVE